MGREKIVVTVNRNDIFFHVFGDDRKYYDINAVLLNHAELSEYINRNRYELEKQFFQKREILNLV